MRLQIIIALVAGLILVAVPLYLWRRPRPESIPSADAATADAGAPPADGGPFGVAGAMKPFFVGGDAAKTGGVSLSPFTTIKCQNPGPGKTPPERCDHVTFFEDGLARSIRENAACAPQAKTAVTVSYVLEMDFKRKRTNLYAGKSTSIKRERAKELLRCIKRAMPTPEWAQIPHQYEKYKINVLATYPPTESL